MLRSDKIQVCVSVLSVRYVILYRNRTSWYISNLCQKIFLGRKALPRQIYSYLSLIEKRALSTYQIKIVKKEKKHVFRRHLRRMPIAILEIYSYYNTEDVSSKYKIVN